MHHDGHRFTRDPEHTHVGPMSRSTFFVAGATGYTGREVVRLARERGCRVVAHIRPESKSRATYEEQFDSLGAEVDLTPWEPDAIARTLKRHAPTHAFALLGTTKSRAREEERRRGGEVSYETVDYGLTMMLLEACEGLSAPPRFIYLSSMGIGERAPSNAYMFVRWRVEKALAERPVPFTIVRPSFITGPDRDELRPGERVGATLADGALALVGALGGGRIRDRYQSLTNTELADAMVQLALDPDAEGAVVEADELRARASGQAAVD